MEDNDRRVHAVSADGKTQIVRYDRQGRWFMEFDDGKRERIRDLRKAVAMAMILKAGGGEVHLGRPGGRHFDAKYRASTDKGERR